MGNLQGEVTGTNGKEVTRRSEGEKCDDTTLHNTTS